MKTVLASAVCGFIFGCGLIASGMMQPAKVLGFLDVFGTWDPESRFHDDRGARCLRLGLRHHATAGTAACSHRPRYGRRKQASIVRSSSAH